MHRLRRLLKRPAPPADGLPRMPEMPPPRSRWLRPHPQVRAPAALALAGRDDAGGSSSAGGVSPSRHQPQPRRNKRRISVCPAPYSEAYVRCFTTSRMPGVT